MKDFGILAREVQKIENEREAAIALAGEILATLHVNLEPGRPKAMANCLPREVRDWLQECVDAWHNRLKRIRDPELFSEEAKEADHD